LALPGVTSTIKDRFYALSRTNLPIGPKIVVLGRRTTANLTGGVADLDPYNLQDESAVIDAFGEGSDIHRAFIELLSAGAPRVTVVALPSDTTFDYDDGTISSDDFDDTFPPGEEEDLFDTAFAAVEAAEPDVVIAWGRGSHPNEWQDPATPDDDPDDFGFVADNSAVLGNSLLTKVANAVAGINERTHPCLGVMGVKPYVGVAEQMTPGTIASHLALPDLVSKEIIPTNGKHMVVVVGEIHPIGYPVEYGYANGACAFAGSLALLDAQSSPSRKPLFNSDALRYKPTEALADTLVNTKGVTPITTNFRRNPIWADARTFSKAGSDYERITTIRIVNDTINLVRQIAERFVGEVASIQARNALETAITSGLRGMQIAGALVAADFVVTYDPLNSSAIIDLTLTPAFELRNIEIRVSIQL
jgi:hypothetical protein